MWVQSLDLEDPLEEDTATHSSILTWRLPWTDEPGGGGGGAVTAHRVAKSQTRWKRLSTHTGVNEPQEPCCI